MKRVATTALLALVWFAPAFTTAAAPGAGQGGGGSAAPQAKPSWIWLSADGERDKVAFFRKEFTVGGPVKKALLYATCDNQMWVNLNGQFAATSDAWEQPVEMDATLLVKPGKNVLAVKGQNRESIAGLVVKLQITTADGKEQTVVTDRTWLASAEGPKGWQTLDFDARAANWKAPHVHGEFGVQPWGAPGAMPGSGTTVAGATPGDQLQLLPGFKADLIYSVPKGQQGSWVSMTFDPKGRIIASDQNGSLYRITLPKSESGPPDVERLDVAIGMAQGLLCAFDSLYVVVNGRAAQGSGLYRLRDTDGNDQYDQIELLKKLEGSGEHGPHAVVLAPDQQSLYVVAGNFTKVPEGITADSPHKNWGEDLLLPRLPDGGGHDPHVMAPGGWVARTDKDGKQWTLICAGLRNSYDIDFNLDGELFTFDSDMEWDTGTPWYRPTRANHVVSGGEYGWRNGSGKWPAYSPDSLPGYDVGYSSPTGVTFGTGAKFPAKYQRAFFIQDWSYGKVYAMHFTPAGSSYTATFEQFVAGKPLPVTDLDVGPDGAMYFTTGGRGTQSGLYRVRYVGGEPTDPVGPVEDAAAAEARALRRKIEGYHGRQDSGAVEFVWPYLDSADRNIRYAARVTLEHQDPKSWIGRAFAETRPTALINALVAVTRSGQKDLQDEVIDALKALPLSSLTEEQVLEALRVYGLAFIRMGEPDRATVQKVVAKLDPLYPSPSVRVNRELAQLLVYLQAPTVVGKSMELLKRASTQEEQLYYVLVLRLMKDGWTPEHRKAYFSWINNSDKLRGGNSFKPFVLNIKKDAMATLTDAERRELAPFLEGRQTVQAVLQQTTRQYVHNWQMEDILPVIDQARSGRDFERGKAAFEAAQCLACHRFNTEGGSTGPDITGAGSRFSERDLLETILLPSKVVSDQYANTRVQTTRNQVYVGRIERETDDVLVLRTHPLAGEGVEIPKARIKDRRLDRTSVMPEGLVSILTKEEVLDLLAYLRAGGKPDDPAFRK